jgi:hypothetical protein
VLLITALLGGACGDDDETTHPKPSSTTVEETTSTTQPAGTDPAGVRPYIEGLLARLDVSINQIVADPGVAADRNNSLVQDYLALFDPDSMFAEGAIDLWVQQGAQGISTRPYSDDAPALATELAGDIETVSESQVTFPTCEKQNYRGFDGEGRETEIVAGQSVPGRGTAVRVDGQWRLQRLDVLEGAPACGGDSS